jgi:hypothetical protein
MTVPCVPNPFPQQKETRSIRRSLRSRALKSGNVGNGDPALKQKAKP